MQGGLHDAVPDREVVFVTGVLCVFMGAFAVISTVGWNSIRLWGDARAAGAQLKFLWFVGMRLRGVPPRAIVPAYVRAAKAGISADFADLFANLEAHHLGGGNVDRVVSALIVARSGDFPLDFRLATTLDLLGRDILEEARSLSRLGGPAVVSKASGDPAEDLAGRRLLDAMEAYDRGLEGATETTP